MSKFLEKYLVSSALRRPDDGSAAADGGGVAETPSADAAPSFDAFRQVMAFDPFTPPAEKGAEGGEGEAPAEAGKEGAPAGAAPAQGASSASPEPPAGPAKGEGEGGDPTTDLRAQVAAFLAKAQTPVPKPAEQPVAQPQPQAKPAADPRSEPARPAYDFAIPDQIMDGLESEDKNIRRGAYKALTDGIANRLAQDFGGALQQLVQYIHQQVPQQVLNQVAQRQTFDGMKADLYGAFPELGRVAKQMPAVEQAIWGQIKAVGERMGITDWTQEFRDGVGRMLHLNLGIPLAGPQTAQPQPQAQSRKPRAGSFSAGGAATPRSNGADTGNDFMSVLNAGTN